jgi:hypothetical protein
VEVGGSNNGLSHWVISIPDQERHHMGYSESIDKVKLIRERLKIAQSRQKSYANNHRRDLEFQVEE